MAESRELEVIHPKGEIELEVKVANASTAIETFGGVVHVSWDDTAAVTPFGQLVYFVDFLKTAGLWELFVADSPLEYKSPNAPKKADVLGALLLSVLAGQKHYSHITAIRTDNVVAELLGMGKIPSEDSVRRAFLAVGEAQASAWLTKHLLISYQPLLKERWILDIDSTVKPLYGHQQGAVKGYNPGKPGRPSHVYHSYFAASIRLVLDVEVQAGNQMASSFAQPELWKFLDKLLPECLPAFLRGDCGWGTEKMMLGAESRKIPYLFKLKQTSKVKTLITKLFKSQDWVEAGQGWTGIEGELELTGWSSKRRVIVMRKRLEADAALAQRKLLGNCTPGQQMALGFVETQAGPLYEYAVLVTSLPDPILSLAQHYRDRADVENNFDELKNQWGWSGFTTQDIHRCQVMARMIALFYNWWSLFVRLAIPDKHAEAITSRPLLLHSIARRTKHAGQTTLHVTSTHAKNHKIQPILRSISDFLQALRVRAEQLTFSQRWHLILSKVFVVLLKGRPLHQTPLIPVSPGFA